MATSDDEIEPDNMTGGEGPVAVDWKLLQKISSIKPQQQKAERDKTIVCTADHNTSKSSAAEVHHDNQLFSLPPKSEDCPTCGLILPQLESGKRYQPCCGKLVCSGCLSEAVLIVAPPFQTVRIAKLLRLVQQRKHYVGPRSVWIPTIIELSFI